MNTFYQAPVGRENWSIKHIETRHKRPAFKKSLTMKNPNQLYSRLPRIKPKVIDVNPRHASKVLCNHYRTQDRLCDSSRHATRVVEASLETIERVKETLSSWQVNHQHLNDVIMKKVETDLLRSPRKRAACLRGDMRFDRMWITGGGDHSLYPSPSRSPS